MTYGRDEFEQDQMDRGRDRDDEEAYEHQLLVDTWRSHDLSPEDVDWDEDTF